MVHGGYEMEWNDDFCTLATLLLVKTSTTPPELEAK